MREEELSLASHNNELAEVFCLFICAFFAQVKRAELRNIEFYVISNSFREVWIQSTALKCLNCIWISCIKSHQIIQRFVMITFEVQKLCELSHNTLMG